MKISASIYSGKHDKLSELVHQLDEHGVDCFHVDCLDDPNVFDDIEHIRTISDTPLDLHLITDRPMHYFDDVIRLEVEQVTFQYENLRAPLELPAELDMDIGIALTSETPLEVFKPFADRCRHVLLMTTEPGKSGGTFNKKNFQRIRQFRTMFPGVRVHVDGGVNAQVSFILRNMGVDQVVSGSYLLNNGSIGKAMLNLKHTESGSAYYVKDFMIEKSETPLLQLSEATDLEAVIDSIEHHNMGLTIVTGSSGRMEGIITNADLRRGLKRHIHNLDKLQVRDMINRNPVVIREDQTVRKMLRHIKQQDFPILYLPVVNSNKEVTGIITFNNLIKGEL